MVTVYRQVVRFADIIFGLKDDIKSEEFKIKPYNSMYIVTLSN